jgi:hypothetical protein
MLHILQPNDSGEQLNITQNSHGADPSNQALTTWFGGATPT